MASVNYEEIYSRFYTKADAYDLVLGDMSEIMAEEFLCNWLHSAVYEPYIRRLFDTIVMDDDEGKMEYEMSYSIDDLADNEFIINLLSYGILYEWVQPKVNSITSISQMFSDSDKKFFSQSSHLSELRALRDDLEYKMRALVRDRGYLNNTYLDGTSAASNLRS